MKPSVQTPAPTQSTDGSNLSVDIPEIASLKAMGFGEMVALDEDLVDSVRDSKIGTILHHKLVIQPFYSPVLNGVINRQYEQKNRMIAEALTKGDFHAYVFLHERPYRIEAFEEMADRMDDKTYWEVLGSVYVDSENIAEFSDTMADLLQCGRPGRENIMSEDEREALAALPDELTLYKGLDGASEDWTSDFSFSTKRSVAEWFANRFTPQDPTVMEFRCKKSDAIAHFLRRNEFEILVDPADVTEV